MHSNLSKSLIMNVFFLLLFVYVFYLQICRVFQLALHIITNHHIQSGPTLYLIKKYLFNELFYNMRNAILCLFRHRHL